MGYLSWILARLESPGAVKRIIGLALVLALPSLFSPLVADDHIQQILLEKGDSFSGVDGDAMSNFFVFASGDPAKNARLMEDGIFPWWSAEDFKLAFARPISVATHLLDAYLWSGNGLLIHAHSLAWFALLLFALWRLFRRFHGLRLAGLALLIYAVDDARGMVLSFAANRNALIAGFFGVCVLLAHDRWRRDGWRVGAYLAPALLAVGLLAGESALATTAFLFGYAVTLDTGGLRARLARLVPYAAVVLVWQTAYSALGYGTMASGVYIHPLHEPLAFMAKLLERAPVMALGQLGIPPSDLWLLAPFPLKVAVYPVAIAVIVAVGYLVRTHLRDRPELRFWIIGSSLSLIPISATFTNDRLLVFVGMGASVVLAALFLRFLEASPPAGLQRRLFIGLVGIHLVLAPLLLPVRSLTTAAMAYGVTGVDRSIPRSTDVTHKTLVVVYSALEAPFCYQRWERRSRQIPQPHTLRLLATGFGAATITRLDERTLRVRPDAGFYPGEAHRMIRGLQRPMAVGHTVALSNVTVTVTEIASDGRAQTAEFRFSSPLESPAWLWMRGEAPGLVPWSPPAVGETVTVDVALF